MIAQIVERKCLIGESLEWISCMIFIIVKFVRKCLTVTCIPLVTSREPTIISQRCNVANLKKKTFSKIS